MAHFAWLDEHNKVFQVSVVINSDIQDLSFPESEAVGVAYLTQVHGAGKTWKQTSYNTYRKYEATWNNDDERIETSRTYVGSFHANGGTPFRGQYAGIGDYYDAQLDEFVTLP
jgi:hypothetical protein